MSNLSEKIQKEMKERHLTFIELSKVTGVSTGNLSGIVTGKINNPGIFTVAKIADVLELSLDELVKECSEDEKRRSFKES